VLGGGDGAKDPESTLYTPEGLIADYLQSGLLETGRWSVLVVHVFWVSVIQLWFSKPSL